jgi:two-component system sensor histidine kinase VicK
MKRVGQRLNQLVADLLDASRVEMGRVVLERRPLSIGQTVRALVDEIAPTLGEHPLDLDLDEGAPLVDVDPGRLDQIVTNLLDNAAKYSPPGTTIRVHVGGTADGAVLTVEDHGEGIAPGEIPLLFDRLHQGPRTRIRKSGLGLGLYITKGLVEAHGGRIWVESEHGRGSRFHVWLPRVGDIGTSADAQPGRPS